MERHRGAYIRCWSLRVDCALHESDQLIQEGERLRRVRKMDQEEVAHGGLEFVVAFPFFVRPVREEMDEMR